VQNPCTDCENEHMFKLGLLLLALEKTSLRSPFDKDDMLRNDRHMRTLFSQELKEGSLHICEISPIKLWTRKARNKHGVNRP